MTKLKQGEMDVICGMHGGDVKYIATTFLLEIQRAKTTWETKAQMQDNIKIDLKGIGFVDWIHLNQDRAYQILRMTYATHNRLVSEITLRRIKNTQHYIRKRACSLVRFTY
jgi:hypothetical protein